jgi:hypothetical protein
LKKYIISFVTIIFIIACSSSTDPNSSAPSDHTINKDGVLHKSGLNDPEKNCTSCHGANLQGGESAPSCYKCHNKKW